MRLTILHNVNRESRFQACEDGLIDRKNFSPVALIDVQDIEDAYIESQHTEEPWFERENVTRIDETQNRIRSTSVGDVFLLEDGSLLEVGSFGYNSVAWRD